MKTAVIVGYKGQDGQLLFNLLKQTCSVIGIGKNTVSAHNHDWEHRVDIKKYCNVSKLIKAVKPDYVYYLAAYHHSSSDNIKSEPDLDKFSFDINVSAFLNFLISVKQFSPATKIFYAASCHVFGVPVSIPQSETTPMFPDSAYGITKKFGLKLCDHFRLNHNIYASAGILYNHESSMRPNKFISKKIVDTAIQISSGIKTKLVIGDVDIQVDWGHAGDYVKAMKNILDLNESSNFIISSGRQESLKNFIAASFDYFNLDWLEHTIIDPSKLTRKPVKGLCGDSSKLYNATGWSSKNNLKDLARLMISEIYE